MSRGASSLVRAVLGIAISIGSLAFVLRGVDLASVADILRTAIPAWIGVALILQAIDVLIRAVRWQQLVAPIRRVAFLPMLELSAGRLPRQQRPAGAARRARPEPLPG